MSPRLHLLKSKIISRSFRNKILLGITHKLRRNWVDLCRIPQLYYNEISHQTRLFNNLHPGDGDGKILRMQIGLHSSKNKERWVTAGSFFLFIEAQHGNNTGNKSNFLQRTRHKETFTQLFVPETFTAQDGVLLRITAS